MRRNRVQVHCSQCGNALERPLSRLKNSVHHFCNLTCTKAFQKGKQHPRYAGASVPCAHCGEPVHVRPSKLKNQENHFCSRSCLGDWRSTHILAENHPRWKGGMVIVACEYCETPLERYQCQTQAHDMFFCNSQCKGKWQSENLSGKQSPIYKKTEVPCSQCGILVLRHPSRINEHKNHFCSRPCLNRWISENHNGPNSHQWNPDKTLPYYGAGWNRIRREIRYRDGFHCCHCKITEKQLGQALDVHHVVPLRSFNGDYASANQASNLLALCRTCHNLAENGSILVRPKLL